MSYTVTFWAFAKKANSTKIPSTAGTQYTCEVVDTSGILNPTIKLHTNFTDPSSWTYARITQFNRYYFISNWRYDRGLWWADLSVDVLASWKTNIGNFTGYVLRAAGASDGNIKDAFYPAKTTPDQMIKVLNLSWFDELSDGSFVVGVINGDPGVVGSVNYYVMSPSEFTAFCEAVYDNTGDWLDTANINDISEELLKTLFNPFEYVVSCMWFPITVPTLPGALSGIPLGWWTVPAGATGVLYTEAITNTTYSITPDQHPQAATRGNYLNSGPYTSLMLNFQPFGNIPLDASLVCGNQIDMAVYTDYISGVATLFVRTTYDGAYGTLLYSGSAQLGVPIQISGRQPNIASMISGAVAAVVDGIPTSEGFAADISNIGHDLLGLPNLETVKGAISGVANAASTGFKRLSSIGSNGSRSQILTEAYLSEDFMLLVDENNAEFGRPLYQTKQISTLSGFIQMGDANIEIPALESEKSMISKFLLSGFFYE